MEYFGVSKQLFGRFVLISFRSYARILICKTMLPILYEKKMYLTITQSLHERI